LPPENCAQNTANCAAGIAAYVTNITRYKDLPPTHHRNRLAHRYRIRRGELQQKSGEGEYAGEADERGRGGSRGFHASQYFVLCANFIGQRDEMEAAAFETRVCAVALYLRFDTNQYLRRSFAPYLSKAAPQGWLKFIIFD
jgi:hypothetical protein